MALEYSDTRFDAPFNQSSRTPTVWRKNDERQASIKIVTILLDNLPSVGSEMEIFLSLA